MSSNKWHKAIFDDVVRLKRGYDLPNQDIVDGEYPVVTSSDIKAHHNIFKVKPPGVVTGRSGTLGIVQFIKENFWPLNTALYAKDFRGNEPKFVYYFLKVMKLENFNAGAGVPTLNQNHLHKIPVLLPPKIDQEKIAAVLSAYDDLIDNNKRRIGLLEKMAEEIYREWFVRFRFPGYQTAEFEKGIPKEWDIKNIKEIVDRKKFGRIYRESELDSEGNIIVIDQSRNDYLGFYNGEPQHRASIESPMILFGDHTCKMVLMMGDFSLAENVIPFLPKNNMPVYFLFHLVKNKAKTTEYKRHWTELTTQKVLIPNEDLQMKFSDQVVDMYRQIESLKSVVENLVKTRDLLLPRLISGKLSVADLGIQFPHSMVDDEAA